MTSSVGQIRPVMLPMYDWPAFEEQTRQLEAFIQVEILKALGTTTDALVDWPPTLPLHDRWKDPRLFFTQTCGFPLVTFLAEKVIPVLTPHYDAPGCQGPLYCSHVLVRADSPYQELEDLRGQAAAFNSVDSQSGYNAFRHRIAPFAAGGNFFSKTIESGGHLLSMQAVAEEKVDVCCVDAVCWELAIRSKPDLASLLRPIAQTQRVPGLPYVTSANRSSEQITLIRTAARRAFTAPETAKSRKHLGICGFSQLTSDDYAPLTIMREEAHRLSYPELR